jgi:hypothetical protein
MTTERFKADRPGYELRPALRAGNSQLLCLYSSVKTEAGLDPPSSGTVSGRSFNLPFAPLTLLLAGM